MKNKLESLKGIIESYGSLAVAFSGGVDSSFLLAVAREVLGDNAAAVIAKTAVCPEREAFSADMFCKSRGITLIEVYPDLLDTEAFKTNPPDRCWHCKKMLMGAIKKAALENGFGTVAEGSNADDVNDYRPGMRALSELGIKSPLREAGLTKAEIRALSREMGLPTWDKPSLACLATRFPYGDAITEGGLRTVDAAEEYLHDLGIKQLRVRVHGSAARIETEPKDMRMILENREIIAEKFHRIGFNFVSLDLDGFASGSMNRVLTDGRQK